MILVAHPGTTSRRYSLYDADLHERAHVRVTLAGSRVVGELLRDGLRQPLDIEVNSLEAVAALLPGIIIDKQLLEPGESLDLIALSILAPSAYFLADHEIHEEMLEKLSAVQHLAPGHVTKFLSEYHSLHDNFPDARYVAISDSAFHARKPNYAWNYGIDIHDADRFDIKRFGYHGLSVASCIDMLWDAGKLPPKVIVCHIGNSISITGVFHGRTVDTTMGLSPLEGPIMGTRSGTIDYMATRALRTSLALDESALDEYLHTRSGLVGLAGTQDIPELLAKEAAGDHVAHLGLATFIHSIHKSIGSMLVALNGADMLVFTGAIGEHSAALRKRIVAHLEFTDFILDGSKNDKASAVEKLTIISQSGKSRPIAVIPTREMLEIARHAQKIT